ncbi:MAG: MarR family transcriptional regulator, partial [Lysobacter sp.]|nr:MarR family transcriptional regulator [Lysobacter sp.]
MSARVTRPSASKPASPRPHARTPGAQASARRAATPDPHAPDHQALDLERFLPYRLSVLSNRISQNNAQGYAERFGIGITEWRIMGVLAAFPAINANQICIKIGMDKAAISRSLQILEKQK